MDTSIRRSSARLRERHPASSSTNAVQTGKQSLQAQSSTPRAANFTPDKRRKVTHEPERQNHPEGAAKARADGRVKGRRGHLRLVTEMPMDVLYEIFSSLEPIDLLHLSWASKTLHSIIMRKSARYLWEDAFKAMYSSENAPPPCPPDLNFAQYTRLLFDKRCMMCNSPHGSHVAWHHRLRVCASCLETDHFTVLAYSVSYRYWAAIPMIRTFVRGKYQTYALSSDFIEVKNRLDDLALDSEEWREYTKQRGEWMISRRKDEWNFMQWQRDQKRGRKNELESIRIKRRNTIVEKLNQLGWEEELSYLNANQLWTLPGVRVAKVLTDKAWETLCPEIIEHLKAVKVLRHEREMQERIERLSRNLSMKVWSWAKQQAEPALMPRYPDLALTEPFKSFVLGDSGTEPAFMTDEDEFANEMVCSTERWNESRNEFLASLLPKNIITSEVDIKGKGKADIAINPLELATVFFQCPLCVEPISYPRVLAHGCQQQSNMASNRRDTDPVELSLFYVAGFKRPWMCVCHDLAFDQEASDVARAIVHECGENPDVTTASRMDENNCRLECTRCFEPKRGSLVMKWRMAIQHEIEKHGEGDSSTSPRKHKKRKQPEQKWRLISDPEDLAAIYIKEDKNIAVLNTRGIQLECKVCRVLVSAEPRALQNHWRHLHHTGFDREATPSHNPMPDDVELRTKFKLPLDAQIKASGVAVRLSLRQKKAAEDVKMESAWD